MQSRRNPWFEITLAVVILMIHVYAAFSDGYNFPNAWFIRDDAYYYFKVAQNITEGLGSSFDGINLTNGYHPLWLLINIPIFALARFDLILPLRILLILLAGIQTATSILIYRSLLRVVSQPIAILGASFWAFDFYIHFTVYEQGLETALAVFMVVWLLQQLSGFDKEWRKKPVSRRQLMILSGLASLVVFSRLDLIFLVALIGLWVVFRGTPLRFLLPLDILVLFIAMTSAFVNRIGFLDYFPFAGAALLSGGLSLLIKLPIFYAAGLYQHPRSMPIIQYLGRILLGVTAGSAAVSILFIGLNVTGLLPNLPRTIPIIDWVFSLLLVLLLRISALWFSRPIQNNVQRLAPVELLQAKWREWLRDGSIYYGILGGVLSLYLIWNKLVFQTFTPVSGQVKHWWGSQINTIYDGPPRNWLSFFGMNIQTALNAWQPATNLFLYLAQFIKRLVPGSNTLDERYYVILGVAFLTGAILLIIHPYRAVHIATKLGLVPLGTASMFQILYYTASGYAGYKEWYWIAQMLLLIFVTGLLLDLINKPFLRAPIGKQALIAAGSIASLVMALALGKVVAVKMPYHYFPEDRPYMEILPLLEENTPPGSVIGMTGGGNVGYFIHDRTITNMDGLINSYPYFLALKLGNAAPYLKSRGMDVVFANPGILNLAPYNGQFAPYLQSYGSYSGKDLMYLLPEPKY